jgi:hypothetical protein
MKLLTVVAVFLMLLSGIAFAQDKPQEQPPAGAQAMPPMGPPQPAPEMEKYIKMFSGRWKTKETFEKSPMMPNGGTGAGEAMSHPGPGGLSLMDHYKSQSAMGAFEGAGATWFDPKDKMYHTFWCDSMTPTGCQLMGGGKWEGENLVFTNESEMNGQKFASKMIVSDIKPDSYKWTMLMGPAGTELKPFMTMEYTKVGEAEHKH